MPVGAGLAVAGVGSIVGGIVSSKANNNATKASMRANDQALAYQKEQDQYLRSRYELEDKREEEARAAYREYLAANGRGGGTPKGTPYTPAVATQVAAPQGQSLRDLAAVDVSGRPAETPAETTPLDATAQATPRTLRDLSEWSDWDQYLQRQA